MLTVNTLLVSSLDGHMHRVLWLDKSENIAYFFDMNAQGMPYATLCSEIDQQIEKGTLKQARGDSFIRLATEDEISDKSKLVRNQIWAFMETLVLSEPDIYDKGIRCQMVSDMIAGTGKQRKTIHRYLKQYWFYGKNKNAFLPQYAKRGGKGKERPASSVGKKRGRPRKYDDSTGRNTDETVKAIFEKAVKKYYHTRNEYTFKAAYEMMLQEFFTSQVKQSDGSSQLELLPQEKLPTLRQFRYWYSNAYNIKEKLTGRKGESTFSLEHRAILGKSDYGIMGPGAKYQIDATVGDIYLVSRFNRADIIGRPVVYFVVDVFSRMVTGMYVGLEGPSWAGAMMAIANAAGDKVKYCAEYGVEISEEDWPCHHIPEAILGDRGEMESNSAETFINALNVRIENAPPYRGDMKGIVERQFRTINTSAVSFLPGHVKPDMSKRGGKDYRLDAKLDLQQFTKIMILNVLARNNTHFLEGYERDADMIADGVLPIPLKLWEWGIPNRSGRLRSCDEDAVRLCLMPAGTATVSAKGICFKGIYYLSERAVVGRWFETARAKGSFKVGVSYDPRNMSRIYTRLPGESGYDVCVLADWEGKYRDRRLEEIVYLMESEKLLWKKHDRSELKARLDLNAEIEGIVKEAEQMTKQADVPASKAKRTKDIRANRAAEKEQNRRVEAFVLGETEEAPTPETPVEDVSPVMKMIVRDLEERLNDGK